MAYRRQTDFEERDYYSGPQPSRGRFEEDIDVRRRTVTRSPPRSRAGSRVSDELDVDVRFREGERDRTPAFLRPGGRRTDTGPLVLRQRDVETFDRRQRSPSPPRERERIRRPRSVVDETDVRIVERERERRRSPSVVRRRSPSPGPIRFVERERRMRNDDSSEHDHIRIVEREREHIPSPSPSPSPPPPPPVIRGPIIERDVITHYTDIDHGLIRARRPSPSPAPRPRAREVEETRETDIDIQLSRGRNEIDVDVRRSASHHRSQSRPRRRHYDDDLDVVVRESDRLRVDSGHRRSRSAAPLASPVEEESNYITGRIDSRGRMGEAWGGHTKEWTIVDVPPGTERLRMDGVGGGSTDTHWSRYSGVRRTQFIPQRGEAPALLPPPRDRGYDKERDLEIDIDIDRHNSRPAPPPLPPPQKEMWTEITKDLVMREAIEEMGYPYEETNNYFYVMVYLRYDDVTQLIRITDDMRKRRSRRSKESVEYGREYYREDWHSHKPHPYPKPRGSGKWDEERVTEVVYDSKGSNRRYIR